MAPPGYESKFAIELYHNWYLDQLINNIDIAVVTLAITRLFTTKTVGLGKTCFNLDSYLLVLAGYL